MAIYFLKRIASAIPTLLGISVVCFFLVQMTPGGPVEQTIAEWRGFGGGEAGGSRASPVTEEQRQMLIHYYGFDKPILTRYFDWLGKIVTGDLGESYYYNRPVSEVLASGLPVSLCLGMLSFFLTYLISIPLGILKAVKN